MSAFGSDAQQKRLAAELKRLRIRADISGRELSRRSGISQSTVSKVETGEQKQVSADLIVRWCRAVSAPDDVLTELLDLAERIKLGPDSWAEAGEDGDTNLQAETAKLEAASRLMSFYMPAAIPGLLQTASYARRLFSSGPEGEALPDIPKRVMDRLERQRILSDESKYFRFVIPEAVLRWPYGPPGDAVVLDEHREQLARVEWATGRPNVELGILPLAPVAVWRLGGFVIYDEVSDGDPLVHIEWLTRPYNEIGPDQVEMTRRAFANLMDASVAGDEARRLITGAADDLRA